MKRQPTRRISVFALSALLLTLLPLTLWAQGAPVSEASVANVSTPYAPPQAKTLLTGLPQFGIGVRLGWMINTDPGRDLIVEEGALGEYGLHIDALLLADTLLADRLRVGLEWRMSDNGSVPFFGTFRADFQAHHLMLTADYSVQVLPMLAPYIHIGAGAAFYDLSIGGDVSLESSDNWLFTSYGALGLELSFGTDWQTGLRLEVGHSLRASPSFVMNGKKSTPEDADEMAVVGTRLGSIPMSDWLSTLEVFLRY